jgi:hypothetical protein
VDQVLTTAPDEGFSVEHAPERDLIGGCCQEFREPCAEAATVAKAGLKV